MVVGGGGVRRHSGCEGPEEAEGLEYISGNPPAVGDGLHRKPKSQQSRSLRNNNNHARFRSFSLFLSAPKAPKSADHTLVVSALY